MSGALLTFNPESEGIGGDRLLFGVAVPPRSMTPGFSALEELDLAVQFLDARSQYRMRALLRHIIARAASAQGRAIPPEIALALLRSLERSAAAVRSALRPGANEARYPSSPEAIFGAELEGLSPEDREFESARRFVHFAEGIARAAAAGPDHPTVAAKRAEQAAAHRLAPGLSRAIANLPANFRARRLARRGQP